MNERIRKEALRAAAKVALALTPVAPIAACGGSTFDAATAGNQSGTSQRDKEASSDTTDDPLVAKDSGAAIHKDAGRTTTTDVDAQVTVVDAAVADAADAKCVALLDSLQGDAEAWAEQLPVTPETTACCETVLKAYTASFSNPDAGQDALIKHMNGCCGVEWTIEPDYSKQPQWVHMACSPWGPPMPPAMIS